MRELCSIHTGVRSGGGGGGWGGYSQSRPPQFIERATPLSYCTSNRYCDATLAESFISCSCLVCSNGIGPFKIIPINDICLRIHQD